LQARLHARNAQAGEIRFQLATMLLYARAGAATDGLLACVGSRRAARAFSASFSQRRPKFRRSSAMSGELASLARRAHSAAWAWQ